MQTYYRSMSEKVVIESNTSKQDIKLKMLFDKKCIEAKFFQKNIALIKSKGITIYPIVPLLRWS